MVAVLAGSAALITVLPWIVGFTGAIVVAGWWCVWLERHSTPTTARADRPRTGGRATDRAPLVLVRVQHKSIADPRLADQVARM
jgi:hypothetical protein